MNEKNQIKFKNMYQIKYITEIAKIFDILDLFCFDL